MISDGIENCVQYIHNFDPEKSKNPFAYFTQIIHYAFLRRIRVRNLGLPGGVCNFDDRPLTRRHLCYLLVSLDLHRQVSRAPPPGA